MIDRIHGAARWTWRHRDGVLLGLALVALLGPVVYGFVDIVLRGPADPYLRDDIAVVEIYTLRAQGIGELFGPYSRFGWHHPGPIFFYLLAPFHALGGDTVRGLMAGALAINVMTIAAIVLVAVRAFSVRHAMVVVILMTAMLQAAGLWILWFPWNPAVTVLPFLLFLLLCWALATGRILALVGVAAAGSYLIQTHVSYGMLVAVLAPLALVLGILTACRRPGGDAGARRVWIQAGAGFVVVMGLLWAAPAWTELTREPGNLEKILTFVTTPHPEGTNTLGQAGNAIAEFLGTAAGGGLLAMVGLGAVVPAEAGWVSLLVLVAAAATVVTGLALGRRRAACLAGLAAAGIVVGWYSATRVPGTIWWYLVVWALALGTATALAATDLVAGLFVRIGDGRPRVLAGGYAATLLVVLVAGVATARLVPEARPDPGLVAEGEGFEIFADALESELTRGDGEGLVRPDDFTWPATALALRDLARAGEDYSVAPEWVFMFGEQVAPDGDETFEIVVVRDQREAEMAADPGLVEVVSIGDLHAFRRELTP